MRRVCAGLVALGLVACEEVTEIPDAPQDVTIDSLLSEVETEERLGPIEVITEMEVGAGIGAGR